MLERILIARRAGLDAEEHQAVPSRACDCAGDFGERAVARALPFKASFEGHHDVSFVLPGPDELGPGLDPGAKSNPLLVPRTDRIDNAVQKTSGGRFEVAVGRIDGRR